jgi:hypothetical protein
LLFEVCTKQLSQQKSNQKPSSPCTFLWFSMQDQNAFTSCFSFEVWAMSFSF